MKYNELKKDIEINKYRQEFLDALLRAKKHYNEIQVIKALSKNPKEDIIEKFKFTAFQAQELMDLKKPLPMIPDESITEEMASLKDIETDLKTTLSNNWCFKILNTIPKLRLLICKNSNSSS